MATSAMALSLFLAISICTLSLVHAGKTPPPMFVFGDRFADVGNNNYLSGAIRANYSHYGIDFPGGVATGRFSNGRIFVDFFAEYMGWEQSPRAFLSGPLSEDDIYKGLNFASGGSGISVKCVEGDVVMCLSMEMQIDYFKQVKSFMESKLGVDAASDLIANSIFLIITGTRDMDNFGFSNVYSSDLFDVFNKNLITAYGAHLKELYGLGARKFALTNIPALGKFATSRILDFLKKLVGLDVQGILDKFASLYDASVALMVKELSSTLPGMKYSLGNAFAILLDMLANAEKIGVKDVTSTCCGQVKYVITPPFFKVTDCTPTARICANRGEYLWFEELNPTEVMTEYASLRYYYGNQTFSSPMNIQDLVEYESSSGGIEAM
uniref:GDSL esterase/lipase At4g16230 n=1 Tax=Anthurium amnicola TaxID=1678845 RepID=A0A1D1YWK3_9ARAE